MSDEQPAALVTPPSVVAPASALPSAIDASATWPAPARPPRARLNALAMAALILALMLSPVAAIFGHIAAGQITRSRGRERGTAIAWFAIGLGYLWLAAAIVGAVALWQLLAG